MVRLPIGQGDLPMRVICPACGKVQEDEGRRNSCVACGFQPIPSYAYDEDCAFHPSHRRVVKPKATTPASSTEVLQEMVKRIAPSTRKQRRMF